MKLSKFIEALKRFEYETRSQDQEYDIGGASVRSFYSESGIERFKILLHACPYSDSERYGEVIVQYDIGFPSGR